MPNDYYSRKWAIPAGSISGGGPWQEDTSASDPYSVQQYKDAGMWSGIGSAAPGVGSAVGAGLGGLAGALPALTGVGAPLAGLTIPAGMAIGGALGGAAGSLVGGLSNTYGDSERNDAQMRQAQLEQRSQERRMRQQAALEAVMSLGRGFR